MLCRIDGINNYISFSDNINVWRQATLLQTPKYTWELLQMGNCGSPIETPEGWLVITHGVGRSGNMYLAFLCWIWKTPKR